MTLVGAPLGDTTGVRLTATAGRLARWRGRGMLSYLLVLVGGGLLLARWQVDGVLRQMAAAGGVAGSGLSFPFLPWRPDRVGQLADAWACFERSCTQAAITTTRSVAAPGTLQLHLMWLDVAFVAVYVVLLGTLLGVARQHQQRNSADVFVAARRRMLTTAVRALPVLAVVDVLEDVALYGAYRERWPLVDWIGPGLSAAKTVLALVVIVPLLVAAIASFLGSPALRRALAGARSVVMVVGIAVVLLLVMRLGTQQVDDVVRAWSIFDALVAAAATMVAAVVVIGGVRELTDLSPEHLQPAGGANSQPLLLIAGLLVGAVGTVLWAIGWGWGLLVAAALLLLIFAAGIGVHADAEMHDPMATATPVDAAQVRERGRWLARVLGAGLCVVTVWMLVRAATFDALVRIGPARPAWAIALVSAAMLLAGAGLVIVASEHFAPPADPVRHTRRVRRVWLTGTAAAFLVLWATAVPADLTSLAVPAFLGSIAVLMLGVAAGAGGLAAIATGIRNSGLRGYSLPPALRLLNLARFPVIVFVLVWAMLVAVIDPGGFHDAQRFSSPVALGTPPSLEQAYDSWLAAGDPTGARPLVLVGAQGGGIRAAVWTALVMECVFGPSPLAGGSDVCAHSGPFDRAAAGAVVRDSALPVFLASGASGGSVGLAAWSARRIDLAAAGSVGQAVPASVDDVLPADYLAPDLARLLSSDALYLLLAHRLGDRASVLERSFEQSWGAATGTGLSRGLRASWDLANGPARQWRIPVLALNGSQVEDGCRFVASPVDFLVSRSPDGAPVTGNDDHPDDLTCSVDTAAVGGPIGALPQTTQLIDYLCPNEDVTLATAAHLSARFPYVSPTARVAAHSCDQPAPGRLPDGAVSYVIDGGFGDNSGAATATQAWRALLPTAAAREKASGSCVVPIFLQIDNSVTRTPNAGNTPPLELLAPGQAVLSQLGVRESVESDEAQRAFPALRSAGGRAVTGSDAGTGAWFRIAPSAQPGIEPPLGWTLSPETVADMRDQLLSDQNRTTILQLRKLLTAPLTCAP